MYNIKKQMSITAFYRMLMYDQRRLELILDQYEQECKMITEEYYHVTSTLQTMPDEVRELYRIQLCEMIQKVIRASSDHYTRYRLVPNEAIHVPVPSSIQQRSICMIKKMRGMVRKMK